MTQDEAEAPPARSAGLPILNRKHKRVVDSSDASARRARDRPGVPLGLVVALSGGGEQSGLHLGERLRVVFMPPLAAAGHLTARQ